MSLDQLLNEINSTVRLDDRHDVRKFKERRTRIEQNTRASGIWKQLDPNDEKEQRKHELYEEIYTSKTQMAEYKLKLLNNEDKAIAYLKKSVATSLHMHMDGLETAAQMFKALTPKTHVLDSLTTLQEICNTTSSSFPTAEAMLEELKKLHQDLQQSVTKQDQRLVLPEILPLMLVTAKLSSEYSQIKTDQVLYTDKSPHTMLELIELVRIFTKAKETEQDRQPTQVAHKPARDLRKV